MSYQDLLTSLPAELQSEILEMDTFFKSLRPLKFKRRVDKKKINYVSSDYGISYAIFPLDAEPTQAFGWYYLYNKETKIWYRKTDYFIETLNKIAETDPLPAECIFNAINECKSCNSSPCSAISYVYGGKQKMACYGRVVLSLCHDDFNQVRNFFRHLNMITEVTSTELAKEKN